MCQKLKMSSLVQCFFSEETQVIEFHSRWPVLFLFLSFELFKILYKNRKGIYTKYNCYYTVNNTAPNKKMIRKKMLCAKIRF